MSKGNSRPLKKNATITISMAELVPWEKYTNTVCNVIIIRHPNLPCGVIPFIGTGRVDPWLVTDGVLVTTGGV